MIVGIDPSSSHIGIATISPAGDVTLQSIRFTSDWTRTMLERVFPAVYLLGLQPGDHVAIEKPPPTAHADVNHGHQAVIGYSIGRVTGAIEAYIWGLGYCVYPELVPVSDWRQSMMVAAARRGLILAPHGKGPPVTGKASPARSTVKVVHSVGHGPGTGKPPSFDLAYGCGHRRTVGTFAELQLVRAEQGDTCPACEVGALRTAREVRPEDATRDHWKSEACRFAKHLAPEAYDRLVVDARSRAKTLQPDYRLEGVADACEALGIAVHCHAATLAPVGTEPRTARER